MRKLLIFILLLPCFAYGQQTYFTPGIPPTSSSFTPSFRYIGTDSLVKIFIANGNRSSQVYTAAQANTRFGVKGLATSTNYGAFFNSSGQLVLIPGLTTDSGTYFAINKDLYLNHLNTYGRGLGNITSLHGGKVGIDTAKYTLESKLFGNTNLVLGDTTFTTYLNVDVPDTAFDIGAFGRKSGSEIAGSKSGLSLYYHFGNGLSKAIGFQIDTLNGMRVIDQSSANSGLNYSVIPNYHGGNQIIPASQIDSLIKAKTDSTSTVLYDASQQNNIADTSSWAIATYNTTTHKFSSMWSNFLSYDSYAHEYDAGQHPWNFSNKITAQTVVATQGINAPSNNSYINNLHIYNRLYDRDMPSNGVVDTDYVVTMTHGDSTLYKTPVNALGLESSANKATNFNTLNNTLYPTTQAVNNYVNGNSVSTNAISTVLQAQATSVLAATAGTFPDATAFNMAAPVYGEPFVADTWYAEHGSPTSFSAAYIKNIIDKTVAAKNGSGDFPISLNALTGGSGVFYSGCDTLDFRPTGDGNLITPLMELLYYQKSGSITDFATNASALQTALNNIPLDPSSSGLVYVNPATPWITWGFHDGMKNTGLDLMGSLEYYAACQAMATLYTANSDPTDAATMTARAALIKSNITTALWDSTDGMFYSASVHNQQIDILGSAYAVYLGVASPTQITAISNYLVNNYKAITFNGYVKQSPTHWLYTWNNMCGHGRGNYDDGYWSVGNEWVSYAMYQTSPVAAYQLVSDFVNNPNNSLEYYGAQTNGVGSNIESPMGALAFVNSVNYTTTNSFVQAPANSITTANIGSLLGVVGNNQIAPVSNPTFTSISANTTDKSAAINSSSAFGTDGQKWLGSNLTTPLFEWNGNPGLTYGENVIANNYHPLSGSGSGIYNAAYGGSGLVLGQNEGSIFTVTSAGVKTAALTFAGSGVVNAVTPATGTNTTQLATMAAIQAVFGLTNTWTGLNYFNAKTYFQPSITSSGGLGVALQFTPTVTASQSYDQDIAEDHNITLSNGAYGNNVNFGIRVHGTYANSSGVNLAMLNVSGKYTGTSSGGGAALSVFPYIVSQGSNPFYLVNIGTGTSDGGEGTNTSKFSVDASGNEVIAGSLNKVTVTAPTTSATLTIANGKTLTANNSITIAGTDATVMTFPSTSASVARTDAAQTFTGIQSFTSNPILNTTSVAGQVWTATNTSGAGNWATPITVIHGNSTTTGTATTAVTVTIGSTMANTNYYVGISPQDLLTAVNYYISAKTTTTFTVTFVSGITGSINFDWNINP